MEQMMNALPLFSCQWATESETLKQIFWLKAREGFKSSGRLRLSETHFTSQDAETETVGKGRNQKGQTVKRRRKSRDGRDGETLTSGLCEMGGEE